MDKLLILNTSTIQLIAAAAVAKVKHPDLVIEDITVVTTEDIDTLIGTLTAQDMFILACLNQVTAATGKLSKAQLGALYNLLNAGSKGTQLVHVPLADINSSTTIGLTTADWEVDAYAGKWLHTIDGTGKDQLVKITSNTSTTLTVPTLDTTGNTDTEFEILESVTSDDTEAVQIFDGGNAVSNKLAPMVMWEALMPGVTAPLVINFMAGDTLALIEDNTATSVGNSALTQAGAFTGLTLAGAQVYVKNSTLGTNQVRDILSHTDDVLTLTAPWTVNPTGTIKYRVLFNKTLFRAKEAVTNFATTYMYDVTNEDHMKLWQRLIDEKGVINEERFQVKRAVPQDLDYLYNTVLKLGDVITDYLGL